MANPSDYTITTFQRKPGLWRCSILSIAPAVSDRKMKSILTDEDSLSEKDAEQNAMRMIRMMDD